MMMHEHEKRFVLQLSRLSKDLGHPLDQDEIETFIESIPNPSFKFLLMAYSEVFGELTEQGANDLNRRLKLKYESIMLEDKTRNAIYGVKNTKQNLYELL